MTGLSAGGSPAKTLGVSASRCRGSGAGTSSSVGLSVGYIIEVNLHLATVVVDTRHVDETWEVNHLVVQFRMVNEMVLFLEPFAVVIGHDDRSHLGDTGHRQCLQQPSNTGVDLSDCSQRECSQVSKDSRAHFSSELCLQTGVEIRCVPNTSVETSQMYHGAGTYGVCGSI